MIDANLVSAILRALMRRELRWPARWQSEAIEAVSPYVDSEYLLEIWVGDPETSIHGTLVGGYVFAGSDKELRIIYHQSGNSDVYEWRLPLGPVLQVKARLPGKRRSLIFAHPSWSQHRTSS